MANESECLYRISEKPCIWPTRYWTSSINLHPLWKRGYPKVFFVRVRSPIPKWFTSKINKTDGIGKKVKVVAIDLPRYWTHSKTLSLVNRWKREERISSREELIKSCRYNIRYIDLENANSMINRLPRYKGSIGITIILKPLIMKPTMKLTTGKFNGRLCLVYPALQGFADKFCYIKYIDQI